jgi:hypothetical protein
MGLIVKRSKKHKYQLSSSISDESHHPTQQWITQDEAKKLLIERAFWKFVEQAIEIDMEFPTQYNVNDRFCDDENPSCAEWMVKNAYGEGGNERVAEKFNELCKKHDLDLTI